MPLIADSLLIEVLIKIYIIRIYNIKYYSQFIQAKMPNIWYLRLTVSNLYLYPDTASGISYTNTYLPETFTEVHVSKSNLQLVPRKLAFQLGNVSIV